MRRLISGALAATFLVAACSSSGSGGGAGPDVCGLLTAAELRTATGVDYAKGSAKPDQDTPYGTYSTCLFQQRPRPSTSVTVATWSRSSAFDTLGKGTAISGLGDRAVKGDFGSVYVVAKGRTLFVQFYSLDGAVPDAKQDAIARALAEDAVARL